MNVNTVEQWTEYPLLLFRHYRMRTRAGLKRVAVTATWAGIHAIGHIFYAKRAVEELF